MKTISQASFTILLLLALSFSVKAQSPPYTSPQAADTISRQVATNPDGDSSVFEVLPLIPSDRDAWFMHLWWTGDNGFSFSPSPKHNHLIPVGSQAKMTAITTENYGSGGPPPLTYNFTTEHEGNKLSKVLDVDKFLHVQTYRNAVIHDTMYLIVTYGNTESSMMNGRLKFDVGIHAKVCDGVFATHPQYFPNGEVWDADEMELTFTNLDSAEERSVLIPVRILENREEFLEMFVYRYIEGSAENSGMQGYDYFTIAPAVARSHDPNVMIAQSDAKNKCDYRGGNIHYTVKFQNDGDGSTHYVRVECHLDDKVDLNSITNVKVPSRFYQSCVQCDESDTTNQIRGSFMNGCGAVWAIDFDRRMLIVEMHNIKLYSSTDPNLPRIDMARGQIEFDVQVKDNYVFGVPVIAHSEIFFDKNDPIATNVVKTGCDEPVSLINGGGFQSGGQLIICQWIWWIVAVLVAIILLLIFLLIRSKRKRRKLLKQLEKAE